MPKMKTNRGAAKRFKITKNKKVRYNRAYGRHLMTSKPPKRKRRLRQKGELAATDVGRLKKVLPYSF